MKYSKSLKTYYDFFYYIIRFCSLNILKIYIFLHNICVECHRLTKDEARNDNNNNNSLSSIQYRRSDSTNMSHKGECKLIVNIEEES